jgi:hypothetical protein
MSGLRGYIAAFVFGPHFAASDRGGGPGTYTKNGVRCTMDAPFSKGMGKGEQVDNPDPTFNKPRTGGGNGLPTRVSDRMGGPKAGGTGPASQNSRPGPIST